MYYAVSNSKEWSLGTALSAAFRLSARAKVLSVPFQELNATGQRLGISDNCSRFRWPRQISLSHPTRYLASS